jgi:8-oxo-dGTP pyrophosphatase MutT (NUDIX family)
VDRSLTDDLARWLAPADLRPAVVPAPLVGLVRAVAAARPEELSRNDPVPDTVAERQAAVLILIATDRGEGPDVLLQQRAPKLRDHAGEVAFPGGAREEGDAGPPATAIREAAEETGVDPAAVEPLILLPRLHIPPSRFDVTGVLAHWRTPSPVSAIDPRGTNRVLRIPFTALADPENRIMLSTRLSWYGPAFVLDRIVVWGYTGEILAALLRLEVGSGRGLRPTRSISTRHGDGPVELSIVRATASDRGGPSTTGILRVGVDHTGASRSSQSSQLSAATAWLLRPTS